MWVSVSHSSPSPPGTAAGSESAAVPAWTHSSCAASPSPLPVPARAATRQAISPTAMTARAPRGGRSSRFSGGGEAAFTARQYWNRGRIRRSGDTYARFGGRFLFVPPTSSAMSRAKLKPRTVEVHGRPLNFLEAGSGPVLLLIHGMAGTCANWESVIEPLAINNTVIAPDFPGHGASAPGGGDYSVGALASVLRDLMLTLGHERATLVGHSLGGGVAMQFTYQFPEMVERLVLVSSGGLGPDVSPILRAAALPGAELFISATAGVGTRIGSVVGRGLGLVGLRPNADVAEVTRDYATLTDPERRKAFVATLRSVVGMEGQR